MSICDHQVQSARHISLLSLRAVIVDFLISQVAWQRPADMFHSIVLHPREHHRPCSDHCDRPLSLKPVLEPFSICPEVFSFLSRELTGMFNMHGSPVSMRVLVAVTVPLE